MKILPAVLELFHVLSRRMDGRTGGWADRPTALGALQVRTVLICGIDYTQHAAAGDVADTSRRSYNTTLSTVTNYLEVKLPLFMP